MGMKYYAKSKKKGLSDKERGKQIKEPEEEQKTLNSHQEDIVRCAEAFFEEYGRYFSEKEKRLVIEACRIHDWGEGESGLSGNDKSGTCRRTEVKCEIYQSDPSWTS